MLVFSYDGSYAGLLCCVFEAFERKKFNVKLKAPGNSAFMFTEELIEVSSDLTKAKRVADGLQDKLTKFRAEEIYWAFLSEEPQADQQVFNFLCYIYRHNKGADENISENSVFRVKRLSHKVFREIHRMHAFVRFTYTEGKFWVAVVEPECNVLPVLGEHFAARYADHAWVIADKRRKQAICYSGKEVYGVSLEPKFWHSLQKIENTDSAFEKLWQTYFKAVNIPERANDRLQRQHVPTKYRKYLPEFRKPS